MNLVSLTTVNRKRLYQGQPGVTAATLYTVPASTDVKLQSIILCNTTGTSATITLHVTPGVSAAVGNAIVYGFPVQPNDTVTLDAAVDMTAGDLIVGLQGTASAITVTVSGETYA